MAITTKERLENKIEEIGWDLESSRKDLTKLHAALAQQTEYLKQIIEHDNWSNASFLRNGTLAEKATEIAVALTKYEEQASQLRFLQKLQDKLITE